MNTKMLSIGIAIALMTVPATAMAGHAEDDGESHDAFPGLPGAALFGLCQASDNAHENATVAPPFAWLFANEDCQSVSHPSEDRPGQAGQADEADQASENDDEADKGQDNRPDHAGPP